MKTSSASNKVSKPIIKLKVGQWWLYRDSRNWEWPTVPEGIIDLREGLKHITERTCAVVIVDLTTTVYGDEEVKVEFMISDEQYSPFLQGDTAWFIDESFSAKEGYFVPFWDPMHFFIYENESNLAKRHGANCMKCKAYYPYADSAINFKCWACKNGY